jgi:hypothetical protein
MRQRGKHNDFVNLKKGRLEVMADTIWNEKNELVDPGLKQYFEAEREKVLGTPYASRARTPIESQALESQTADPMTTPTATDTNKPSKFAGEESPPKITGAPEKKEAPKPEE